MQFAQRTTDVSTFSFSDNGMILLTAADARLDQRCYRRILVVRIVLLIGLWWCGRTFIAVVVFVGRLC